MLAKTGEAFLIMSDLYHQQYLAIHVDGYRCHSATDVPFPPGV